MKITFTIDYLTTWGEILHIAGTPRELGCGHDSRAVEMSYQGNGKWGLEVELPDDSHDFGYRYLVKRADGTVRHEWGKAHIFTSAGHIGDHRINDRWQDRPAMLPFYSSAFKECIFRRDNDLDKPETLKTPVRASRTGRITINVSAPLVRPGQLLAITGEGEALGNWEPRKAIILEGSRFPVWAVTLPESVSHGCKYKFIILGRKNKKLLAWEEGPDRVLDVTASANCVTTVNGLVSDVSTGDWKGAGTVVPVFSLRSHRDFGCGDFMDLIPMIDWLVLTGQNILQTLPVNDTTVSGQWTDSYPYNAISSFALHPLYLRPDKAGVLKSKKRMAYYRARADKLNSLPELDYEGAFRLKMEYIAELFAQDGIMTSHSKDYKDFICRNEDWLLPYAAFCINRDKVGSADFSTWGSNAAYTPAKARQTINSHQHQAGLIFFIQYHLDRQLREVRDYGRRHGIALKGDIPIGISRQSADAWAQPRLFNLDSQAGAPPDDFATEGQNWGFPTYNWTEMARDNYSWWKARLRHMSQYFDAYRIDHLLGFFRIWQIPAGQIHGLLGMFNPSMPYDAKELKETYGFAIDPLRHCRPVITDTMLYDLFGEKSSAVSQQFFDNLSGGTHTFKKQFSDQRCIVAYLKGEDEHIDQDILRGLLRLTDEVLFIEDPLRPGFYHPRIEAYRTASFLALGDHEREAWVKLYHDYYYGRHDRLWHQKAMEKLPVVTESTSMLACAEDLGMIPSCVAPVMEQLRILSLEIERMPKEAGEFGHPKLYPYLSVCATSTHDMPVLRAWWQQDAERARRYFDQMLIDGSGRSEIRFSTKATVPICREIINRHLQGGSMLCILPLQDWLATDSQLRHPDPKQEQINDPSLPNHYWRYRMHIDIEQLTEAQLFNRKLKSVLLKAGRGL